MTELFMDKQPKVSPGAWVHQTAAVIGDATLAEDVSVWPGAVIRADVDRITVGKGTNVQDLACLHPNGGKPVLVGEGVTIGHCAIVHGSVIGDHCLVGMGAIIMESEVGEYCLVAAGAVVTPGSKIAPRSMVMGAPGKVKRQLTDEECSALLQSEKHYIALAAKYKDGGKV